jgi:hypothetical protein
MGRWRQAVVGAEEIWQDDRSREVVNSLRDVGFIFTVAFCDFKAIA